MVDDLKIDFYSANTREIVDGFLTGKVLGEIVDRAAKADALRSAINLQPTPAAMNKLTPEPNPHLWHISSKNKIANPPSIS